MAKTPGFVRSFFQDFRQFAVRGNVVDLAVAVIIGGAFGAVTKSIVDDVVMPPLGLLIGKVDFKDMYVPLDAGKYKTLKSSLTLNAARWAEEHKEAPPSEVKPTLQQAQDASVPLLRYGLFINNCINFVLIAFVVFVLVKLVSRLHRAQPAPKPAAPEPTPSEKLLAEIRDLLKPRPGK